MIRSSLVLLSLMLLAGGARADNASRAAPSLAEAYAVIRAHPKIDLTHAFGPTTPVWSGFGQARMTPAVDPKTLEAYTISHDGFRATYYAMVGQYGTHVDPPAHFAPTGRYLDELAVDDMILPLVVLDDTPYLAADPAHAFSVSDLESWEKAHGRVPAGSFVALRTDMAKDWERDPARFKRSPFPGWSLAVLKVLFEQRGAVAIGHEALDTDATPGMESERYVLGHDHWQIEVMDNLDKVPPTGALLVASWPKPKNGLGFPARVFAVLP
jgi:kynurenine formamidase